MKKEPRSQRDHTIVLHLLPHRYTVHFHRRWRASTTIILLFRRLLHSEVDCLQAAAQLTVKPLLSDDTVMQSRWCGKEENNLAKMNVTPAKMKKEEGQTPKNGTKFSSPMSQHLHNPNSSSMSQPSMVREKPTVVSDDGE